MDFRRELEVYLFPIQKKIGALLFEENPSVGLGYVKNILELELINHRSLFFLLQAFTTPPFSFSLF